MPDYTLRIIVDGDDRASGPLGNATSALGSMATVAGGILGAQFFEKLASSAIEFGRSVVEAASESEDALALLTNVIARTGDQTGVTVDQAVQLAKNFQQTTQFSDEQVMSAEKIIATFERISSQTFPVVTQTALDMSTVLGIDATNAARMLGRALEAPEQGMSGLRRMGIVFTEQQKEVIKHLVKTGDVAGAQAYMLEAIQNRIGGSAEAMGNTFSGVSARLKNQWDEVKEAIGTPILPFLAAQGEKLIPVMTGLAAAVGPFIDSFLAKLPGLLQQALVFFGPIIDAAKGLFSALQDSAPAAQVQLQSFLTWFSTAMGPVLANIVATVAGTLRGLTAFWKEHGDTIMAAVQFAFRVIVATVMGAVQLISGIIDAFMAIMNNDWSGAWDIMKNTLKVFMELALSIVGTNLDSFLKVWRTNWEMAKTIVAAIWDGIVKGVEGAIKNLIDKTLAGLLALWDAAKKLLKISSPSALFAELGGQMMAGMAQGINAGQAMPAMTVAGATQAVAAAGASTVHNYYLTAQYGHQDERSLAGDVRLLQFMRG